MKQIKFRGVSASTGEHVYGDLSHDGGHIYINDKRVLLTSVAQLLGTDENGDELYDGDTVTIDGEEFYAELAVVCYSTQDNAARYIAGSSPKFTLKKN